MKENILILLTILQYNKIITLEQDSKDQIWSRVYHASYGRQIIPSQSDIVCQWDLLIHTLEGWCNAVHIGISSQTETSLSMDKDNGYNYWMCDNGYVGKGATGSPYGDDYRDDNSKLSVQLDLMEKRIKYLISDKDQGVAFTNIGHGPNINYRLLVCICGNGVKIEILNFQTL